MNLFSGNPGAFPRVCAGVDEKRPVGSPCAAMIKNSLSQREDQRKGGDCLALQIREIAPQALNPFQACRVALGGR